MSDERVTCDLCIDHAAGVDFCLECGEELDPYGNSADDFRFCSFPDCGCDGSRLCMAPSGANEDSASFNVEGMYSLKGKDGERARLALLGFLATRER